MLFHALIFAKGMYLVNDVYWTYLLLRKLRNCCMYLLNSKTNKIKEIPKIITLKKNMRKRERNEKVMYAKRLKTARSRKHRLWNENGVTIRLILMKL